MRISERLLVATDMEDMFRAQYIAIRESIDIIRAQGAEVAGIVIALDRQEKGKSSALSASQEIRDQYGVAVISVAGLNDLLAFSERSQAIRPPRSW